MRKILMSHADVITRYKSDYQVRLAIRRGELYKIERGIYSLHPDPHPFDLLFFKHPHAILTMNTAFYIHGLTDTIPEQFYVATSRSSTRIKDKRIVQLFSEERYLNLGKALIPYDGTEVQIYNQERMLVEVMRYSGSMPLDYYKEIINAFRERIHAMDIRKVEDYIDAFERNQFLQDIFLREVL